MPFAYRWPRKMESLLIDYLSKYANYWDNRHKDFYNRIKRRQILIGAKVALAESGFTVDVNSISKKFKNLRTIFIKEYNKAHGRSTNSDKVYEPIWEHYDHLLFLRDATPPINCQDKIGKDQDDDDNESFHRDVEDSGRTSDDTLKSEDDVGESSKIENNIQHHLTSKNGTEDDDHKISNITTSSTKSKEGVNVRRKRKITSVGGETTITPVKTLNLDVSSRRVVKNKESCSFGQDDDPGAFGVLVAHKLRCLSTRNAMMAQTDIIAVLQKYILAEIDA